MSRNISYGSQRSAWTRKRKSPEQCQPTFMLVKHNQEEDDSLDSAWYDHWVLSQISSQPVTLYETIATGDDSDTGADAQAAFHDVWTRTGQYFLEHQSPSVKEIVEHLENVGLLLMCEKEEVTSVSLDLVLAIIGWQTMLFRLDMGSAHPSQIAIVDETDGYRTNAHQRTRQERSGCRSDLHVLLKGFGQVLPSAANPPSVSEDDKPAIAQYRFAAPGTFNAHILSTMAEVEFRWTDSLACHLDFDKSSNVVWLYRFPGFCMLHLRSNSNKGPIRSVLHAAALPSNVSAGKYWASYDEVDEYLREVVLSFRLLFGQKKASRRFFRSLKRARPQDPETEDPFLQKLCSDESFCEGSRQQDRRIYELSADFPLMREKICLLQMHLSIRRPRTWRQLWADKRDSANWYTFWAVLVIGGSGILLGMMQVVLQIVQVAQTARSSP